MYWPNTTRYVFFVCLFFFIVLFFFLLFLNTCRERHKGKQWILRTCRKAGISWTDPCFCQASLPHARGGEEEEEAYGEHLLHSSVKALFTSLSSHPFDSRIPIHKRIKRTWLEISILYVSQVHVIPRQGGKRYRDNTSICNWLCPDNQRQDSRCYH